MPITEKDGKFYNDKGDEVTKNAENNYVDKSGNIFDGTGKLIKAAPPNTSPIAGDSGSDKKTADIAHRTAVVDNIERFGELSAKYMNREWLNSQRPVYGLFDSDDGYLKLQSYEETDIAKSWNSPESWNRALIFQYIPNDIKEEHETKWDTTEGEGKAVQSVQFKSGAPRKITFKLFVNEWAVHGVSVSGKKTTFTPEGTVGWLRERMLPGMNSYNDKLVGPAVLAFVCWSVIPVVITKMTVSRDLLRQITVAETGRGGIKYPAVSLGWQRAGEMIRGFIDLSLTEYYPPSGEISDNFYKSLRPKGRNGFSLTGGNK